MDDIADKIEEMELSDEIIDKLLDKVIGEKLQKNILDKNPLLKMFINDSVIEKIKSYFKKSILENKEEIIGEIIKIGKEKINFREIILEKMENFSLQEIEEIILRISKNELKHIEIIGGVLGGIIAVFQFLLMVALKAI